MHARWGDGIISLDAICRWHEVTCVLLTYFVRTFNNKLGYFGSYVSYHTSRLGLDCHRLMRIGGPR